jgi:uncharacterized protein YbjT (DUF2867 family)
VVFGAGGAGGTLVQELVVQGKPVRAVTHSDHGTFPSEVEAFAADAADPASTRAACAGASVVYPTPSTCRTAWPQILPPVMRSLIAGAAAASATLVLRWQRLRLWPC